MIEEYTSTCTIPVLSVWRNTELEMGRQGQTGRERYREVEWGGRKESGEWGRERGRDYALFLSPCYQLLVWRKLKKAWSNLSGAEKTNSLHFPFLLWTWLANELIKHSPVTKHLKGLPPLVSYSPEPKESERWAQIKSANGLKVRIHIPFYEKSPL